MLEKVINFVKSKTKTKKIDKHSRVLSYNISNSNISRFSFKQSIKNAYNFFFYLIRYKIGYVMPKKGRLQTVIVIARKRK